MPADTRPWPFDGNDKTPLGQALFVKEHLKEDGRDVREAMDWVVKLIKEVSANTPILPNHINMLFSEEDSDIHFICYDGQIVHAHKLILKIASPYFKAALNGRWAENNKDGKWRTEHSVYAVKAFLSQIYCGKFKDSLMEKDPIGIYKIASEWDLSSLRVLAEKCSIQSVNAENLRKMFLGGCASMGVRDGRWGGVAGTRIGIQDGPHGGATGTCVRWHPVGAS
jgi:hypothetical protein